MAPVVGLAAHGLRPASARPLRAGAVAAVAVLFAAACARGPGLGGPGPSLLDAVAPDSFVVEVLTSEGPFHLTLHRHWSPRAVDRAWVLFDRDFWAGARFYRVVDGFVAQWGFSGDPAQDSAWKAHPLPDEPVAASNARGVVSFARSGPGTRSYTLFVNLADNPRLDTLTAQGVVGYPPIGRITEGLAVVDGLYSAYSDPAPRQDSIAALGNAYLRRAFPQLDSIVGTRVLRAWR